MYAAEQVSDALHRKSPGSFRRWLMESVGRLRVEHRALADAIGRLGGIVATLNYDRLLKDALGVDAITWRQPSLVQEVLRGDRRSILHLHGFFEAPDSVVLGIRSYEQVVADEHTAAVLKLFTLDPTILFVGCRHTLADPNFARSCSGLHVSIKTLRTSTLCFARTTNTRAFAESSSLPHGCG